MISRNLLGALVSIICSFVLNGQQTKIIYQSSSAAIANPERGWYDDYYSYSGSNLTGSFTPLNAETLTKYREEDNITLILRLFYLHEFLDSVSISEDYISKMQNDFDAIRSAGVKCIIRFAYSASQSAEIWDATPEIVFSHIESLGDVLMDNGDVIAGVQAGFIGAWGEWYYTENFAGTGFIPDETDQENRRTLVNDLLEVLPKHVIVQGRTPAIMQNINESEVPISEAEAFSGTSKARLGHHNDCFLANASYYGTYTNLEEDLAYLRETTKYTIAGGETCDASNNYSNCENSVPRMKELHWTYLNRDYNKAVYNKWVEEGCYDEVDISLGYRIQIDSAIIADSVNPGDDLNFSLYLTNIGYAAPTHYKPIQFVFTNASSGEQISIEYSGVNGDIRHWLPGTIELSGSIVLPADMQDGNYSLGVRFPDQDTVLSSNPAYSIQLANVGLWNEETGINGLNHIVTVGKGGEGILPETPANFESNAVSESEITVSWSAGSSDETSFELMRSKSVPGKWEYIAEINSDVSSYDDKGLDSETTYYYIIRSKNLYGYSPWAKVSVATTFETTYNISYNTQSTIAKIYPTVLTHQDLHFDFLDDTEKRVLITNVSGNHILDISTKKMKYMVSREVFKSGIFLITIYSENNFISQN